MNRNFFAGANTPQGFFSYYDHIILQNKAEKIISLKGGPGTGKSTLMKKVASKYKTSSNIQTIHCSSDPHSLDGVIVEELNLAVIDGTSPHIVDPKNPAAVDMIFNIGEFWNLNGIKEHKDEILNIGSYISDCYGRGYHYLSIVGRIDAEIARLYNKCEYNGAVEIEFQKLRPMLEDMAAGLSLNVAPCRNLFLSAISPEGLVDYSGEMIDKCEKVIVINSCLYKSGYLLLEKIDSFLRERSLATEKFYSPIFPTEKIEHLYVPSKNVFFTIQRGVDSDSKIDFDEYIIEEKMKYIRDDVLFDKEMHDVFLNKTIMIFKKAKAAHDELEGFYIPHIDFEAASAAFEILLP